jgi:hypothetical protein
MAAKMDKLTRMLLELDVEAEDVEVSSPAVKLARTLLEAGKVRICTIIPVYLSNSPLQVTHDEYEKLLQVGHWCFQILC